MVETTIEEEVLEEAVVAEEMILDHTAETSPKTDRAGLELDAISGTLKYVEHSVVVVEMVATIVAAMVFTAAAAAVIFDTRQQDQVVM